MTRTIKGIRAAVGMSVLGFFAAASGVEAQKIENGNGVICDSPQQVEQMITIRSDFKSAVEQINAESKSRVCEIVEIAFIVGGVVAEASNDKGKWEIRKILVVGLMVGSVTSPVQPYPKYTAFLTSKAAPI
jgi:hypothetical protein